MRYRQWPWSYLVEENLGFPKDVLELGELEVVPLESLCILVHFAEFVFQLLKCRLWRKVGFNEVDT